MTDRFSHPEQEQFFIPSGNVVILRDMDAVSQGAVPIIERYAHLNNVLEIFDRVVELDRIGRLYPIPENGDSDYKPSKQQAMSRNSANSAEQLRIASKQAFYSAYGLVALQEGEYGASAQEIETEAGKTYDRFTMRFAGRHKHGARQKARELWGGLLNQYLGTEPDTTTANEPEEVAEVFQEPGLSTREKLIILAESENAGFLPTTNEEKNTVLAYLDYVRNPDYELGTQSQLLEVGNFHGKHHDYATALEFSKQAGRSIAFEFADWRRQASQQLNDLLEVYKLLRGVDNPNLSLAVALNADMQMAVPLIRYIDLIELRATGKVEHKVNGGTISPRFDVLRTKRTEQSENILPGMNKVLEDPYTKTERSKTVTRWLKARMLQIKVGDIRAATLKDAILDQKNRYALHELILQDLATDRTDSPILHEASRVAQQILGKAS